MNTAALPTFPASSSLQTAKAYLDFQHQAPTPFHVAAFLKNKLQQAGFEDLRHTSQISPAPGAGFYRESADGKSLAAFVIGEASPAQKGFSLLVSHTDSPALRLRLKPVAGGQGGARLLTEMHGSLIQRAWLDRPLTVAGAVYEAQTLVPTLVSSGSQRGVVIPDLAIHLDRDKNTQGGIQAETMLHPLLSSQSCLQKGESLLWESLGLSAAPAGFDLYLAPSCEGFSGLSGLDQSLILSPRHDDLAMVFASLDALLAAKSSVSPPQRTAMCGWLDAEETGSETSSGAQSPFLKQILKHALRLSSPSGSIPIWEDAMDLSFLISADMAHAFHPNHPGKHDECHRPVLNGGLVLKQNAQDRYATSGFGVAAAQKIASAAEVPLQFFISRQDLGCGTTVGPILSTQLGIRGIDMGAPMLGMHSSLETMGVEDLSFACRFFQNFLQRGI